MEDYMDLKKRQHDEIAAFPMFFAFNNKQFQEGMTRLGLSPTDTTKIYKFGDTGGFYRREDSAQLREMMDRHERELHEAIEGDTTGEGFIFNMFNYELANHEYIITGSVADALRSLGLTLAEVEGNPALKHGLQKARMAQFEPGEVKP